MQLRRPGPGLKPVAKAPKPASPRNALKSKRQTKITKQSDLRRRPPQTPRNSRTRPRSVSFVHLLLIHVSNPELSHKQRPQRSRQTPRPNVTPA
jgi:hypothetical protein